VGNLTSTGSGTGWDTFEVGIEAVVVLVGYPNSLPEGAATAIGTAVAAVTGLDVAGVEVALEQGFGQTTHLWIRMRTPGEGQDQQVMGNLTAVLGSGDASGDLIAQAFINSAVANAPAARDGFAATRYFRAPRRSLCVLRDCDESVSTRVETNTNWQKSRTGACSSLTFSPAPRPRAPSCRNKLSTPTSVGVGFSCARSALVLPGHTRGARASWTHARSALARHARSALARYRAERAGTYVRGAHRGTGRV